MKHVIMKPFDLLNTILLTRTKTPVNNLSMNKFNERATKLGIFEVVVLNIKRKGCKSRKIFCTKILCTRKNFTYTKLHKNAALPEKRKENM